MSAVADAGFALLFLVLLASLSLTSSGGVAALRPAYALMRRRMQVYSSYPFAIFATILHGVLLIALVALIGRYLFPDLREFTLESTGTGIRLASYLTVGLIAWPTVWEGYEIVQRNVRTEQTTGMFETLIATPVGVRVLPLAYLLITLPVAILVALVAYFLFTHFGGIDFPISGPTQVLQIVVVLGTGVFMTWGLGLFLGGLTALHKETGPIGGLLKMVMLVFCNVYIPVELFPRALQIFSKVLPLTWAFASIRTVFNGGVITDDLGTYLIFLGYTVLLIVGGLWVFNKSIDRARQDGTTSGY